MRIVLAGSRLTPEPPADEVPLFEALRDRHVDPCWLVWEDAVPPPGCVVVPRATWTYHRALAAYREWLSAARDRGCRFVNSLDTIVWNLDKGYLLGLEARGVPIVPTVRTDIGAVPDLALLFQRIDRGSGLVLKPAVSASGDDTWLAQAPDVRACGRWREAAASRPHLAQPYLPEIAEDGEWSVVIIDGDVVHVVRKRAAAGEFRVQHEHGGSKELVETAEAPPPVLETAVATWDALPETPCYARIDLVRTGDQALLMEAELIDPELYLTMSGGAAGALADAILAVPSTPAGAAGSSSAERAADS